MKLMKIHFAILTLFGTLLFSCNNDKAVNESSFFVRGNCGMCEKRIESTVKDLSGVIKADWDVKSKNLMVAYDTTKIAEIDIHSAVANTGHETKMVEMNEQAHDELPQCCQKYNHGHEEHSHHDHNH